VTFADGGTVFSIEVALTLATTGFAPSSWADMAARWTHKSGFTGTFGSRLVLTERTQTTAATNFTILARWARNGTLISKEALLTHALHCASWSCDTVTLTTTDTLVVGWALRSTSATSSTLVAKTLGLESFALLISDEHTFSSSGARGIGSASRAFVLAALTLETLFALALGLAVL